MTALDFPTSPSNGDTYQNYVYDSTAGVWKRFTAGLDLNDITDVTLTSPTDGQALVYDNATSNWVNGEGSSVPVAVSETAPVSPEVGELWLNSTEAKMYVYYDDGDSQQWVAAVGGTVPSQGKILQVVRATDATNRTTTSPTFVDASLSVTITPQESTSAILLVANVRSSTSHTGTGPKQAYLQITDSSDSAISGAEEILTGMTDKGLSEGTGIGASSTLWAYDNPATTSATTYKVRFRADSSVTLSLQNASSTAQMFAIEVAA